MRGKAQVSDEQSGTHTTLWNWPAAGAIFKMSLAEPGLWNFCVARRKFETIFFSCDCLMTSMALFFFPRLPNGQYGPVSRMFQPKTRHCTGPFNWGGAHCAGEKVKRKTGPILQKSHQKQAKPRRARPATATRNPPARLPGARAKKQQHNTKETSNTDPGTP